ncbi:MAG TPA: phosphatidate cytidylyltransferase [Stellaceae bacterium]|nr:phosphatidate cytidylyltransferase [Stellaceae bacterium]
MSAVVMAPIPLAAIWFGEPWLALLAVLAAALMAWEWGRLCRGGMGGGSGTVVIAIVVWAVAAAAYRGALSGLTATGVGAVMVYAFARWRRDSEPAWLAFGAIWVAVPCVLLLWLARPENAGRATVLWLLAVVWATDIGAYVFGRAIGGPRLAPRWSPGKTWAGLIGGTICAGIVGAVTALVLHGVPPLPLVLTSAGLAIVEQFGDLAESAAKRRFGVKDSSGLIPGHGGLLDRLDGLLAVIPAVALLTLVGGVPTWR